MGRLPKIKDTLTASAASGTYRSDVAPTLRARAPEALSTRLAAANFAGHGWTNTGTTGVVNLNDTSDTTYGSQCITMTTAGTGLSSCHVTKSGLTASFTGRHPVLYLRVTNVAKLGKLELRLGDGTFANLFYFAPESQAAVSKGDRYVREGELVRLVVPWNVQATDGGNVGTPTRGSIAQIRLTVTDDGTGPVTVKLYAVDGQADNSATYPNGVCTFTFDDGYASQYTMAAPYLARYGYAATAFPIVNAIGVANYQTLAQLQSLQNDYGWEVGGHANDAANHNIAGGLPSLTTAQVDADMKANRLWLLANGFRQPDVFAYPQGFYSNSVIATARNYYSAARSQHNFRRDVAPPGEVMRVRTRPLGNLDTLAAAKLVIDDAVAGKEWAVFTLHDITVAAPTTASQWQYSDLQALVDYAAASGIAVRTYGQALQLV